MSNSISKKTIQSVREEQLKFKPGTFKYLELQNILNNIFAERLLIYTTQGSSNDLLE